MHGHSGISLSHLISRTHDASAIYIVSTRIRYDWSTNWIFHMHAIFHMHLWSYIMHLFSMNTRTPMCHIANLVQYWNSLKAMKLHSLTMQPLDLVLDLFENGGIWACCPLPSSVCCRLQRQKMLRTSLHLNVSSWRWQWGVLKQHAIEKHGHTFTAIRQHRSSRGTSAWPTPAFGNEFDMWGIICLSSMNT